jgi:hypothetical protein
MLSSLVESRFGDASTDALKTRSRMGLGRPLFDLCRKRHGISEPVAA